MIRKSLLGLAGTIALSLGVAWTWHTWTIVERPALALGTHGESLLRGAHGADRTALASAPGTADVRALTGRRALTDLSGDAAACSDASNSLADLTAKQQKQVNKLQKKLDKLTAKATKAESKLALLNEALDLADAALTDAQGLPDGNAKDKALAKAQKKLNKAQKAADKAAGALAAMQSNADSLTNLITTIDPTHFAVVDGLSAPEQMAVVTAGDGGGMQSNFLGGSGNDAILNLLGPGDFPPTSDFVTDKAGAYVYDPSMDVLSMVNQILCMLAQTKYDDMVNKGTYIAQVDETLCDQGSGNQSGGDKGQSSGGQAGMPSLWVVHSDRVDDQSDEFVKAWVPNEGDGDKGPTTIRVKVDVSKGVSDIDPFGSFGLNFAGVPLGGTLTQATEHGFLKTLDVADGFLGFSLFHAKGDLNADPFPMNDSAEIVQANVNMFNDQSQGVARIRRQWRENNGGDQGDTGIQTDEFLLAFNDQTVLRAKNGDQGECLSRTDFNRNVWRYNLYEAQGDTLGARVERNSGFGIKTADGKYGWIGYYGLWMQSNVDVQSGDVVTKSTFGGPTEQFTVVSAPGKLIRNTRQTLALAQANGETFSWWDFSAQNGGGEPGNPPPQPLQYQVQYDSESGHFMKMGTLSQGGNGGQEVNPLEPPVVLDVAALGGFLNMWSDSLGGSVSYVNGDDHITYYAQTFVNGSDPIFDDGDDVAFYGFMNCLGHGLTGAQAEQGQVFLDPSFDLNAPHQFVFRKTDLTLYDDADGTGGNLLAVGLAPGEKPNGGPFTWGMQSGPMVTTLAGVDNTFDMWSQPVFYTYETGPNSWNHYATVKDSDGDFVTFDPPLQFTYSHTTDNDANGDSTYNGKKYLLSYNGSGELNGIPMQPVDLDGDGNPDRWYPLFGIADGVLMGPTGTEYAIRAIQEELTLKAAPGGCTLQTVDPVASLPLPDASEYVAPDIGPKPLISDPPAVIAGEVQGDAGAPSGG